MTDETSPNRHLERAAELRADDSERVAWDPLMVAWRNVFGVFGDTPRTAAAMLARSEETTAFISDSSPIPDAFDLDNPRLTGYPVIDRQKIIRALVRLGVLDIVLNQWRRLPRDQFLRELRAARPRRRRAAKLR